MRFFPIVLALLGPAAVSAKAVFAHFMVGNTGSFTEADWKTQIILAKAAGIDAFALNMARDENTTTTQLPSAFTAAKALSFNMFFSFDYAGNGAWEKATVIKLINDYVGSGAYFYRNAQPLVSTFEGPGNATDWIDIKAATKCFFIPDWSSLGAKAALGLAGGVADGLFSWDAWPSGPRSITTYPDASYFDFLKGKPYMAPVSPWFYTNLPGYDKNWLWRGDSLWVDRWNQLIAGEFQPEFVQIISWNDYGESHYIGPLDDRQYAAFKTGRAPYNYVVDKPHNGWRELLPYFTALWKQGTATITQEGVVSWYRQHPKAACDSGGTTGNTATQLQPEIAPSAMVQDEVYFAAPLGSNASVSVTIGGVAVAATWNVVPYGGVGIHSGSAPTGGRLGAVVITLARNGANIVQMTGQPISTTCTSGFNNYNAYVGSKWGATIAARSPPLTVSNMKCNKGFGANGFAGLCEWSCKNGYCPEAACVCTILGAPPKEIVGTKPPGYTLSGLSPAYDGLCAFACARDYCPPTACSYTKGTTVNPNYSPFLPPACTGGVGPAPFVGLCDYACNWGFCPMNTCTCNKFGPLNVPMGPTNSKNATAPGDSGLCKFACQRDYCPEPCVVTSSPPPPNPVENKCKTEDRMYSDKNNILQGDIEIWSLDGTHLDHADDTDGHQYVTIVNLTPYTMVYVDGPPVPYQFSTWNFGDIPSGKSRKNEATYDIGIRIDFTTTNGIANYRLDGTDKTFSIKVTTHIPDFYERRVVLDLGNMGMGWRELGFPGERTSVALVITGSEQYGYVNSLQLNDVAWMRKMYNIIKDRQLRHVVVPGSHDAGMSTITTDSGWWNLGTSSNTETQSLDHYNQLRVGTRYFDMRIVSVNGGEFWSAHVNEEVTGTAVGATGESLDALIAGVNRFTTDYPGEVIVWAIRSMVDLDRSRSEEEDRYWDANKLSLKTVPTFDMQPMKNFMDLNNGKGCVLLLTEGRLKTGLPRGQQEAGIWHTPAFLHRDDYWAEEQYTQQNADKQITRMESYTRNNASSSNPAPDHTDDYFIMQWQCTPSALDVSLPPPTLQLIANQETNPALYHYGVNKMSPESFPTVILHDAVGLFHVSDLSEAAYNPMMQTLAIGLNLYMVPQNCKVSNIKHPLLEQKQQKKISGANDNTGFTVFSGVIFANGTVLDEAPPGFCRTCSYNDTSSIDHPTSNSTSRSQSRRADLRGSM